MGDLLDLAVNAGVADKSGSWFSWRGTRLGQGREKSCNFLRENADLLQSLVVETGTALGVPGCADGVFTAAAGLSGRALCSPHGESAAPRRSLQGRRGVTA